MQFSLSTIVLTLAASAFAAKKAVSSASGNEVSTSYHCSPIYVTVTPSSSAVQSSKSFAVSSSASAASNVITTVVGGETQTHTINSASTAEAGADLIKPAGVAAAAIGFAALLI